MTPIAVATSAKIGGRMAASSSKVRKRIFIAPSNRPSGGRDIVINGPAIDQQSSAPLDKLANLYRRRCASA
jgi:hypothetical protein